MVGSVAILEGHKQTPDACMAWVDEAFARTDYYGCVCEHEAAAEEETGEGRGCAARHCDTSRPARPRQWEAMAQLARRLGGLIGIHMRVDMYASSTGEPVLGEFTPWHTSGRMHCHMPRVDEHEADAAARQRVGTARLRDGRTGATHTVDVCSLGRMWREAALGANEGRLLALKEGGALGRGLPTPPVLRGWPELLKDDQAKCGLAMAYANRTLRRRQV